MTTRKNRVYFTSKTENAIIQYNEYTKTENLLIEKLENSTNTGYIYQKLSEVSRLKNLVYKNEIEYSFNKLAENIINRFKFPYYYDSTENIKKEVISFLMSIIDKYEKNKGKAFSYFSVVAKNYLILNNRNKYEHSKSHKSISIDEPNFDIVDDSFSRKEIFNETSEFISLMLDFFENNVNTIFKKKNDIIVAYSVMELFRKANNIENFNKKALYILLREMTGTKTSVITNVINKMKIYIFKMFREYEEHGVFSTDNIDSFF